MSTCLYGLGLPIADDYCHDQWLVCLLGIRPFKVAMVAGRDLEVRFLWDVKVLIINYFLNFFEGGEGARNN